MSRPLTIKLSASFPSWSLLHQTPDGQGVWQGVRFLADPPGGECDAWVVYEGLPQTATAVCPPENVLLVTSEPPIYKSYPRAWLRQFAHVLTCQRGLKHPRRHLSHMALPWWVRQSYDELSARPFPEKTKALSAIVSTKRTMASHRRRLAYVQALQAGLPLLEVYGRGLRPLEDKWEGLAPYRYSVAIENCAYPDYWTEKIADCFLAGAVPVYHGCPNLADYFPEGSYERIENLDNPAEVAGRLRRLLEGDDYARRLPALREAKQRVLNTYNLFNLVTEFARRLSFEGARQTVRLEPEPPYGYLQRHLVKWRRRYFT